MMRFLLCLLATQGAASDIRFEDHSHALPAHTYAGGWEHFVGGGVAVFDCNADGLPEIFAAGGTGPAALYLNTGEMTFGAAKFPEIADTTGAYPLDIDGDGALDLMVLRVGAMGVDRYE